MSDPRHILRDEAGFTLVETVVAFAILSLVMTTAVQILGAGSVRARVGQDRTVALGYAQSHLATIAASGVELPARSSGIFENGFSWTLDVSLLGAETSALALSPHIAELSVTGPGSKGVQVTLKTILLLRPTAATQ